MTISEKLLEIRDYTKQGYSPVIDYESWRVAILNYTDELLPENIKTISRHDETDEVFVLLQGRCVLFLGLGNQEITDIFGEDMQPMKIYNIKKAVWHTHTLSKDAMVLIVENKDTTVDNSPVRELSDNQRKTIIEQTKALWD